MFSDGTLFHKVAYKMPIHFFIFLLSKSSINSIIICGIFIIVCHFTQFSSYLAKFRDFKKRHLFLLFSREVYFLLKNLIQYEKISKNEQMDGIKFVVNCLIDNKLIFISKSINQINVFILSDDSKRKQYRYSHIAMIILFDHISSFPPIIIAELMIQIILSKLVWP